MKNFSKFIYAFAFLWLAGNTQATAQQRVNQKVSGFTAVKASSGVDVYLSQGTSESVEVEGEEESLKYLITEVDGNTLVIRMDDSWKNLLRKMEPVKVYVSFTKLEAISASGGSDIYGQGELTFEELRIASSGGADVRLNLQAEELEVHCSGGADVVLSGTADFMKGVSSGGSDIKAKDLEVEEADISSSGASDVHIQVARSLKAAASGASDIVYYGNPTNVEISTSGASDITKR